MRVCALKSTLVSWGENKREGERERERERRGGGEKRCVCKGSGGGGEGGGSQKAGEGCPTAHTHPLTSGLPPGVPLVIDNIPLVGLGSSKIHIAQYIKLNYNRMKYHLQKSFH